MIATLHLAVYKKAFNVMWTGEKDREYRVASRRNISLLYNKDGSQKELKYIKVVNGYGFDKPYFIARIRYFHRAKKTYHMTYSNNLYIRIDKGMIIICLGTILEVGNVMNYSSYPLN